MIWLWCATFLGGVPLFWLTGRYALGRRVSVPSWWIAAGFAVSCVTDLVVRAHILSAWIASPVYLVSQGALITAAIIPPAGAWFVLFALVNMGLAAVFLTGTKAPDLLLHTTAFLTIVGVAHQWRTPYRWSLFATFGVGCLAWWAYVAAPGWSSWTGFQLCRFAGVLLFCVATHE